jgi:glycosyltransferase involved in cell wall biosynthesis
MGMNTKQHQKNGRISIAHFSWEFPPAIWGGLGTFATELTKQQIAQGHAVTVFAINRCNHLVPMEIQNGITVYRPITIDITKPLSLFSNVDLQSWGKHLTFFSDVFSYNFLSAKTLIDTITQSNNGHHVDIVESHDWLGILGGMMAKKELDVPLMFHVHSTEHGRSGGTGSPTIKHIEKTGADIADGIITVSYAMQEELQQLGFPKEKIRVCWNGIDPKKYHQKLIPEKQRKALRQRYGIKDDEVFLFFIGRFVTVKGVTQLIEAMPLIMQQFPKVKLVMLGVGDLVETIASRIQSLGIAEHVILNTEFVSEDERILHYAAADVVVLPSLYEPFGIVCTEAMSMEKPVVVGARGVTGLREQIVTSGDQQCGIHVNPFDPADIAWGVNMILSTPERWRIMGQNGRKRVFELFTWQHVADRAMEIYKEFM